MLGGLDFWFSWKCFSETPQCTSYIPGWVPPLHQRWRNQSSEWLSEQFLSFPLVLIILSLSKYITYFFLYQKSKIREGCQKKTYFLWSFDKPPPGPPPPGMVFLRIKKITPIFSFGNKITNGWNKFYIWSHSKILFFCSLILTFFFPGFGPLRLLSKLS